MVHDSAQSLLLLINDILDFSKIEAGRLDLERAPFHVAECVEAALELVAADAATKDLELLCIIEPGTPDALVGDATRVRQVLLNLLGNAVKFTERGEVRVDASAAEAPVRRTTRRHEWRFTVRDTGIGIPAGRLESIFESFTQVDAVDGPALRRHRPGPGDLPSAVRADGRHRHRPQHGSAPAPPSRSRCPPRRRRWPAATRCLTTGPAWPASAC